VPTAAVRPNLLRFECWAALLYRYPAAVRLLRRVVPHEALANSIPGYLMPITTAMGVHP
jgi:hypothetical protein